MPNCLSLYVKRGKKRYKTFAVHHILNLISWRVTCYLTDALGTAWYVELKPRKYLALNTEGVLPSPQHCTMFNSVEGST